MSRMNIGPVIKQLRRQKGWNQEQLAARCSISEVSMSRIETGKQGVTQHVLKRLADIFGLEIHQLMAMAEGVLPYNTAEPPSSRDEQQVLDCFRRLSAANRVLYLQLGLALVAGDGQAERMR